MKEGAVPERSEITYLHKFRIWYKLTNPANERRPITRKTITLEIELGITESPDKITNDQLIALIATQIDEDKKNITILDRLERGLQKENKRRKEKAIYEQKKKDSQ